MSNNRDSWTGQVGFIIAAAASAVGLGNLWRFPASAAKGGGGIFLLTYLILFFSFGAFLLLTEIAIGRSTKLSPIEAFRKLSEKWVFLGYFQTIIPFLIMPYYAVIGGWVIKFLLQYIFVGQVPDGLFGSFVSDIPQVVGFMLVFAISTFVFIFLGVRKGVERSNKVMMPALLLITIAMALFVCFQPGMKAGLRYYFYPDFSKLTAETALSALGQMFFSLSLAMGIMITYGSYVPKRTDLPRSAIQIGVCDTLVAFIAGVVIIPPAFAFGGEALATSAGPGLMFVSLPKIFVEMPFSRFIAILFFVLVLFAALTSSISISETCTASLADRTKWPRRKAAAVVLVYMLIAAIPSAVSLNFLDKTDYIVNSVMMPICALLTCVFIGWVVGPKFVKDEVERSHHKMPFFAYYRILIRYLAPILVFIIFLGSL